MYWKSNRITPSQSFKNLSNLNFLVCYRPFKLTSIDVNMSAISINIHWTHYQTANIDRNHHKNH